MRRSIRRVGAEERVVRHQEVVGRLGGRQRVVNKRQRLVDVARVVLHARRRKMTSVKSARSGACPLASSEDDVGRAPDGVLLT